MAAKKFSQLSVLLIAFLILSSQAFGGLRDIRPRPQQMGTVSPYPAYFSGSPYLVVPNNPNSEEQTIRDQAITLFLGQFFTSLIVITQSEYTGQIPCIWLGTAERFPSLVTALDSTNIPGLGTFSHSEEYQLFVGDNRVLLGAQDCLGLRWGLLSLVKLMGDVYSGLYVDRVYIRDWPDYPKRIGTVNHNMRSSTGFNYAMDVLDLCQAARYTEIELNDEDAGLSTNPTYFSNSNTFKNNVRRNGMKLTISADRTAKAVDELFHQEGIPTLNTTMTAGASGFVIAPNGVNISNSGYETWTGDEPPPWFVQGVSSILTQDASIRHSGTRSARYINPGSYNGGGDLVLRQRLLAYAYHIYKCKLWYKTSNYTGNVYTIALEYPGYSVLDKVVFNPPATQDWSLFEFTFSTYYADSIEIRVGATTGTGTIWFDDVTIEPAPLQNMIRRAGVTPLTVFKEPQHTLTTEGVDYQVVETNSVSYPNFVVSPRIDRITSGQIPLNSAVTVNYACAVQYQGGRQTVCFSLQEPLEVYQRKIHVVDSLFNPDAIKIHINEVSMANYDPLCTDRGLNPGQLVGGYCRQMYNIIQAQSPGLPVRIYSDAFDPNAEGGEYNRAINGIMTSSLLELAPEMELENMIGYSSNVDSSLSYFQHNGHQSVMAVNLDWTMDEFVNWWLTAKTYSSTVGIEWYRWPNTFYNNIPKVMELGAMGWNFGPFIVHTPINYIAIADSVIITAEMWSDTFRTATTPSITSQLLRYRFLPAPGTWNETSMNPVGRDVYTKALFIDPNATTIEYYLVATDHRNQTSYAPADAPTRTFSIILDSSPPPAPIERSHFEEVEYSFHDTDGFRFLEWPALNLADYYEIHHGIQPDLNPLSNTRISRQDPCCPRFLFSGENAHQMDMDTIHVYVYRSKPFNRNER